jgi:hypothetical protein
MRAVCKVTPRGGEASSDNCEVSARTLPGMKTPGGIRGDHPAMLASGFDATEGEAITPGRRNRLWSAGLA